MMKRAHTPRFLGLLVAGFVLVLWWLAHQENLRLRSELDLALAESGKFRVSETKPAETAPDPEEHAELLRLRSEVGALRGPSGHSGTKGSQVEPETGVRKPGEEFVQVTHGMAVSATGEDLGPVPDRFLKGIHSGGTFGRICSETRARIGHKYGGDCPLGLSSRGFICVWRSFDSA